MKLGRGALFVLLGMAALAQPAVAAMNPDMNGFVSGGMSYGLQRYGQSGTYTFGSIHFKEDYDVTRDMSFHATWVQPVLKPLSLSLGISNEIYGTELVAQPTSGGSGYYSEDGQGSDFYLRGGLRFFSAELAGRHFDPFRYRNPDGPAFWPTLSIDYYSGSSAFSLRTKDAVGGYAGFRNSVSYTDHVGDLEYQMVLPIAPKLSVHASFEKESSRERHGDQNGVSIDSSNGGRYETVGLGAAIYSSWWKVRDNVPYGYVPGVGFDGQACFAFSYTQTYDLIAQKPQSVGYRLAWVQAFQEGIGLDVAYQLYDVQSGYFNPQFFTIVRDQNWTQTVSASLSFGWGHWGKSGNLTNGT